MSAMHSGHQFADATAAQPQNLERYAVKLDFLSTATPKSLLTTSERSRHITLDIRQQPLFGKVAVGKEKGRTPLPTPLVKPS